MDMIFPHPEEGVWHREQRWPPVSVASLVRNRAWILPDFLECLRRQDYPGEMRFLFILNSSEDESEEIIREWLKTPGITGEILEYSDPIEFDRYFDPRVRNRIALHLAKMRNMALRWARALGPEWYLLDIDNDLMFPEDMITRLVSRRVDMVSACFSTGLPGTRRAGTSNSFCLSQDGTYWNLKAVWWGRIDALVPVDVVMGAVMLSPAALLSGVEFLELEICEDAPFCREMARAGFQPYLDPEILLVHVKVDLDLAAYREGSYWCDLFWGARFLSEKIGAREAVYNTCQKCSGTRPEIKDYGRLVCPIGREGCALVRRVDEVLGGGYGTVRLDPQEAERLIPIDRRNTDAEKHCLGLAGGEVPAGGPG